MGVYALPWTPAIKIDILSWPKDLGPWGCAEVPYLFCPKPLQYGFLGTPLDPSNQDLTFWANLGPPGQWGDRGWADVLFHFGNNPPQCGFISEKFGISPWIYSHLLFWIEDVLARLIVVKRDFACYYYSLSRKFSWDPFAAFSQFSQKIRVFFPLSPYRGRRLIFRSLVLYPVRNTLIVHELRP